MNGSTFRLRHSPLAVATAVVLLAGMSLLDAGPARGAEAGAAAARPAMIAFTRAADADYLNAEIWTMDRYGGNQKQLTVDPAGDQDPTWSADGSRIAWTRYPERFNSTLSDIWIMNADGSGKRPLTAGRQPTWSPNGGRLAFMDGNEIWMVNADGTGRHQITPDGVFAFDPDWSPDGTRIAFSSETVGRYGQFDLWTMRPDGSARAVLRSTGTTDYDPQWSPDGRRIAYATASWHVSMMRSDGSSPHIVVEAYSLTPAFSTYGNWLVFYACTDAPCGIYRSDLAGDNLRPLGYRSGFSDADPDFFWGT
jgi:Tol biopolymer transport system component